METYTITDAMLRSAQNKTYLYPGVTSPGQYTWNEAKHTYEPGRADLEPQSPPRYGSSLAYESALTELRRQLSTGEATPEQYQWAIDEAESEMIGMHAVGCYDVLGYAQWEATANVYREALGFPPCDITQRSNVSPTLSDQEYRSAMAAQLPERKSAKRPNGGGQLWEPCPRCGYEPVHLDCGYCDRHCQC